MKTFKFLALSLLIATTGLYSSVNIAEASDVTINYRTYSNNDEGILKFLDTNAYATVEDAAANFNRPVEEVRKLWAYNSTHKVKDIIKAVYQAVYEEKIQDDLADNLDVILAVTKTKAKENGYNNYSNIGKYIVSETLRKLCFKYDDRWNPTISMDD